MESKSLFISKTFWANVIAMIAMVVQTQTGFVIDAEVQAALWAIINVVIRFFTNQAVTIK